METITIKEQQKINSELTLLWDLAIFIKPFQIILKMVISKGNFVHKKSKTWHQISEMFFCDEKVKIPFFGSVIKHYQYAPN